MFYASPRNRPEVQIALLEKLRCNIIAVSEAPSDTTNMILQERAMKKLPLPDLDFFLDSGLVERYPYNKTWDQARKDPYVVMHSSGTTGTPKVLVLKQGTVAAHDAFQRFPSFDEAPWYGSNWAEKRVATSFPWLHAGGVLLLACSIYYSFSIVIAYDWPLKGALADILHTRANVQAAWYSPSVLVDVARNPAYLGNISRLDSVSYAGGILPQHVGDAIQQRTRLFSTFALTETGILPGEMPPTDDWNYYHYSERLGHCFEHFAGDMYELVHRRDADREDFQGVF